MSRIFELLFNVIQQLTEWLGYPGIFIMMLVENLIPPIPSEMMMPFAGSLVSAGKMTFWGALLAGTLGSGVGALLLYYFGYRVGRQRLDHWVCRYGKYLLLTPRDLDRALVLFQRHGKATIFFARLVPGARSLISIPAGVNRMPLGSFIVLTLLGTVAWNTLLMTAGFLLGQNWQRVLSFLDTYEMFLYVGMAAFTLYFFYRKYQQRNDFVKPGCD